MPCLRLGATVINLREFDPEVLLRYFVSGELGYFARPKQHQLRSGARRRFPSLP